jgi:hypothetical protein
MVLSGAYVGELVACRLCQRTGFLYQLYRFSADSTGVTTSTVWRFGIPKVKMVGAKMRI